MLPDQELLAGPAINVHLEPAYDALRPTPTLRVYFMGQLKLID